MRFMRISARGRIEADRKLWDAIDAVIAAADRTHNRGLGISVHPFNGPLSASRNDGDHADCHCLSSLSAGTPNARGAATRVRLRNCHAARRGGAR